MDKYNLYLLKYGKHIINKKTDKDKTALPHYYVPAFAIHLLDENKSAHLGYLAHLFQYPVEGIQHQLQDCSHKT